jgi:type II secretory pathway component PulF
MAVYSYTYVDENGKKIVSELDAVSVEEAEEILESKEIAFLWVRKGRGLKVKEVFSIQKNTENNIPVKRKVPRRDLIEFTIYLGTLAESGVSLTVALRDFAGETKNEYFAYVVSYIRKNIEGGNSLAGSMALYPDIFSIEMIHLVKAGEQTGTLPNALREIQNYLEWVEKISGDIRQATMYPLVVSVVLFCFILYLFSFVVPKFAKLLTDMNQELPGITKLILTISAFFAYTWWVWILLLIGVPLLVKFLVKKSDGFAHWLDGVKLQLPFFGGLIRLIVQARFTQNFAVLHRAGISILDNLELCSGFVGNKLYAKAIAQSRSDVRDGATLSESLRFSGLFSGLVLRMVGAGEAVGNLDHSLRHAAKYYDEEVPRKVKKAFAIVEPLIILILVAVVGMVALAIFLPIMSMSGGLR